MTGAPNLHINIITKAQQDAIQAILESGALAVENGDVTLHFQGNIIQSIEIKVKAYQRKTLDKPRRTPIVQSNGLPIGG